MGILDFADNKLSDPVAGHLLIYENLELDASGTREKLEGLIRQFLQQRREFITLEGKVRDREWMQVVPLEAGTILNISAKTGLAPKNLALHFPEGERVRHADYDPGNVLTIELAEADPAKSSALILSLFKSVFGASAISKVYLY